MEGYMKTGNYGEASVPPQPAREKQVYRELALLEKRVEEQDKTLNSLAMVLDSVVLHEPPLGEKAKDAQGSDTIVPLAKKIHELSSKLQSNTEYLNWLIAHLEI